MQEFPGQFEEHPASLSRCDVCALNISHFGCRKEGIALRVNCTTSADLKKTNFFFQVDLQRLCPETAYSLVIC